MAEAKIKTRGAAAKAAVVKPAEAEEVKNTAAKPAAKRTTAKRTSVNKETATGKKPGRKASVKKAEVLQTVSLQFDGKSYTTEDLVNIAKDVWKYDLNQKAEDFKSVELYVKPEESAVYYVINTDVTGRFSI